MKTPFDNIPLNTKRQYVRGIARNGCKIYMPVDSERLDVLEAFKAVLQDYLDRQPVIVPNPPLRAA